MQIFSKLILLSTKSYKQQWSDQQPSQHNTPVPLDHVGLNTGLTSVSTNVAYKYSQITPESVGLISGIVSVTEEDA